MGKAESLKKLGLSYNGGHSDPETDDIPNKN